MKLHVDLHVHSALSPCAEDEMTPGNIAGMAKLNGLDLIALTDHQSCANCETAIALSRSINGPQIIPGIEMTSAEEVHLLALFADLDQARLMETQLREQMIRQPNRPEIFGHQWLFDRQDQVIAEYEPLLLMPVRLQAQELAWQVWEMGGVCIPAHVDRSSASLLASFGSMPPDFPPCWLELSNRADPDLFFSQHEDLKKYPIIRSSDAHRLVDMADPGWIIELSGPVAPSGWPQALISALRQFSVQ